MPLALACQPAAPAAINAFNAFPNSINEGGTATLTWSVSGVKQATIDNDIGTVAASGTVTVKPSASTTYTLTAGQGLARSVTITVAKAPTVPVTPVQEPLVVYNARDTQLLISRIGQRAQVEGNVTYISSWIPSKSAEGYLWVFIFFMESPWEGASYDPSLGCEECWRDFTSYFRLIVKPAYVTTFGYYTQNRPVVNLNDRVIVTGRIEGYQSAPAIYLTDPGQVKITGR